MNDTPAISSLTIHGTGVPRLGFGTFQLSGGDCRRAVSTALDIGYRHVDTAQMYGNEDEVGAAITSSGVDRSEIFVTTKIDNGNHAAADVRSSTETSLRRLGLDHVDLLLIHWPVRGIPLSETCQAMIELQERGLVRHLGVSNFNSALVREAASHMEVFANQVEYHPFLDQSAVLATAAELDHAVTAYAPLARGKVRRNDTIVSIARDHGVDPTAVALAWLLAHERVLAIPKASSREHITANADAVHVTLSDHERARIDELRGNLRLVDPGFGPDWD